MDDYNSPRTTATINPPTGNGNNTAANDLGDLISFATPVIKSAHNDDTNHNVNDHRYMINPRSEYRHFITPQNNNNNNNINNNNTNNNMDGHNQQETDAGDEESIYADFERLREKYTEKIDCLAIMSAINERLVKSLQDKQEETNLLIKEKEALGEEVAAIERSFGELHRRYEKIKSALESTKQSEEEWRNHYLDLEEKLSGLLQSGPRGQVHRKS